MQYPEIPSSVQSLLREVPVTDSDVLSWNTIEDLRQSHSEGDVIIAPNFFEGDSASLTFSKRSNYATLGETRIVPFEYFTEVWRSAVYEAAMSLALPYAQESFFRPDVIEKAIELVSSQDWWKA